MGDQPCDISRRLSVSGTRGILKDGRSRRRRRVRSRFRCTSGSMTGSLDAPMTLTRSVFLFHCGKVVFLSFHASEALFHQWFPRHFQSKAEIATETRPKTASGYGSPSTFQTQDSMMQRRCQKRCSSFGSSNQARLLLRRRSFGEMSEDMFGF